MSAIGFLCEAGKVKFKDCLKECPLGTRCMSVPTLRAMSNVRVWQGKPSTTQLLNGTRHTYLEISKDYYFDPQSRSLSLMGTGGHLLLETFATGENEIAEKQFDGDVTGCADLYTLDDEVLLDYKFCGSYKVAKMLGMEGKKIPDPKGTKYKRNGYGFKKGDIKKITKWYRNPDKIDMWEYEMQLNKYRIEFEKEGKKVKSMVIQANVRDGGTRVAKDRGVLKRIELIPVKRLSDAYVNNYYKKKTRELFKAIKTGYAPRCSEKETWGGLKCKEYCDVCEFCKEMDNGVK